MRRLKVLVSISFLALLAFTCLARPAPNFPAVGTIMVPNYTETNDSTYCKNSSDLITNAKNYFLNSAAQVAKLHIDPGNLCTTKVVNINAKYEEGKIKTTTDATKLSLLLDDNYPKNFGHTASADVFAAFPNSANSSSTNYYRKTGRAG
jgi:hypothetical protein